jgi:hypothetical protein
MLHCTALCIDRDVDDPSRVCELIFLLFFFLFVAVVDVNCATGADIAPLCV